MIPGTERVAGFLLMEFLSIHPLLSRFYRRAPREKRMYCDFSAQIHLKIAGSHYRRGVFAQKFVTGYFM